MYGLLVTGEWALGIVFIGFFAAIFGIAFAALNLKNSAMRDAKRIYERPARSVKNIITTGKGIVQQETVRVKHIGGSAKVAISAVKETVTDVKTLVQSVPVDDAKALVSQAQTALKFFQTASRVLKSGVKQGTEPA